MFTTILFTFVAGGSAIAQEPLAFEMWNEVHSKSIESLDFGADFDRKTLRDSSFLVTGSQDGTAVVWNISTKSMRHRLIHTATAEGARLPVNCVRVSRDGRRIAVGGADGRLTIWDPRTGTKIHDLQHHTGRIWDVGWSADGSKLVTCDDNAKVVVWDSASGSILKQFAPDEGDSVIRALSISPDSKTVVFATRGDKLYFANIETGARYNVVSDLGEEPQEVEYSPNGQWIALAEGETLVIRQGVDGKKVRGFGGHAGTIRGFRWSRDSERIVTAGDGGEVFEWDMRSSTVIAKAKVAQYVNDIAICIVNGIEKFALAKPSHKIEMQR